MSKKVKTTVYDLGRVAMFDSTIHVYYDTNKSSGATGEMGWTAGGYLTVTLGDTDTWESQIEQVLHELMELALRYVRGAYEPVYNSLPRVDTGRYAFMYNHEQYTEACHHVADAMAKVLPALQSLWRKTHGVK